MGILTLPVDNAVAPPAAESDLHAAVLSWYASAARDLAWRRPGTSPWAVLVSEVMLQQTPVARVLPAYQRWLARWPTPDALAGDTVAAAVRAWERLGYPRRALRLHAAAVQIVHRHGGAVPDSYEALRALPGVGPYTAAAVASFAFGQAHPVLDTNARRVLARVVGGVERPAGTATAAEAQLARALVPADGTAARWAVAVMELGALVCTARAPGCGRCPVWDSCRWRLAGQPPYEGAPRRRQAYAGTDRQARGRLLAVLREQHAPVPASLLETAWADGPQRLRALAGLLADGLVERRADDTYALPT